ncbi:MAG TPA: hypothetical protein VKY92_17950 [Verrucomicrobiae bacterium]|nr:hypothetical protein [Verrucomicrobiae bacterium]
MIRNIVRLNSAGLAVLALIFLIYPATRVFLDIRDPALREPGTPKVAWRIFKHLTPRYAAWARNRLTDGRAEKLSTKDISGTEWPLFGSVFYLWAVENLEQAWEAGDHSPGTEPKIFARDAVLAASDLVVDPKQAAWVKTHWGDDYLHRENVFYRMLVIAALSVRERLYADGTHRELLRDQVETLAVELDKSKTGLLEDYPGECYPGDVMAAWMCIKRADAVLGTDHSAMIGRALRAFTGEQATPLRLPPYAANANTGRPISPSRGCANSYMCLTGPELWPLAAREWDAIYDRFFWQERFGIAGFREFPKGARGSGWQMDVDSGPVIAGYGVAANAFGIGASRKNGRFDRAYPLTAEMLATVWELPNGGLLLPRVLSNATDAPLLGEAAILWQLTVQPQKGFPVKSGEKLPVYPYVLLIGAFVLGIWRVLESVVGFRYATYLDESEVPWGAAQIALWAVLLAGTAAVWVTKSATLGIVLLLVALILPIRRRVRRRGTEDWPEDEPRPPGASKRAAPEGQGCSPT